MFGGTPTNVSLPFLSPDVEIVHRRQPADADQGHQPARGDLREVARVVRDQGRGAIHVANELLERMP